MFEDLGRLPEDGFVLKADARTHVWCEHEKSAADAAPVVRVMKLYQDSPLQQRLAWLLGIHPGQRETRWAMRLNKKGIDVALPLEKRWNAGKLCLVYPWLGPSMMNLIRAHQLPNDAKVKIAEQLAGDLASLIQQGLFNRDHKLSNIVVDDDYGLRLVDVGGVRRARGCRYLVRMLIALHESARRAGASRSDCWRVVKRVAEELSDCGSAKQLAQQVLAGSP